MRRLPPRADLSRIITVEKRSAITRGGSSGSGADRQARFGSGLRAALVLAGLSFSAAMSAGCGPIEYLSTVPFDAVGAIGEAQHVDADKYAPYEITAAQEYLHKSRELAGYARYHSAITFGHKAGDNARKAKKLALERAALPQEQNDVQSPAASTPPAPASTTIIIDNNSNDRPSKVIVIPAQSPAQ